MTAASVGVMTWYFNEHLGKLFQTGHIIVLLGKKEKKLKGGSLVTQSADVAQPQNTCPRRSGTLSNCQPHYFGCILNPQKPRAVLYHRSATVEQTRDLDG